MSPCMRKPKPGRGGPALPRRSSTAQAETAHESQLAEQITDFVQKSRTQMAQQSEAFNVRANELAGKAEENIKTGDAELKRLTGQLDELEGRIRESIERATGYGLFYSFQKRQLDIAKAKQFWGYALFGLVLISMIVSGMFIWSLRYVHVYNADFYMKLSISIPLIYAIAFCNVQYSRERSLEEEYAFKSNIHMQFTA